MGSRIELSMGRFREELTHSPEQKVRWAWSALLLFFLPFPGACNRALPSDNPLFSADFILKTGEIISLLVMPRAPAVVVGGVVQFTSVATNRQGHKTDLTYGVTWSSSDENIVTVNSSGQATALQAGGPVTISSRFDEISSDESSGSGQLTVIVADSAKHIFVIQSAVQTKGDFGGPVKADVICNGELMGSKALLVDGTIRVACTTANCSGGATEHTDWILAPNQAYFASISNNHIFTTNENGVFVFGKATNPIEAIGNKYWSGLEADWTTSPSICTGWTDNTNTGNGAVGQSDRFNQELISRGLQGCNADLPLVCVEQ